MNDGKSYGFGKDDVRRLKATNARQERYFKNRPPKTRGGPVQPWQGMRPAKATAGFTAGSVASPTTASVTLYMPSGTGFTATGGAVITAYNPYTSAITANALVWVTWFNNHAYIATANC